MDVDIARDSDLDDSFYELCGIYLHPDYYRMGIGSKAMKFALEKAHEKNKKHIVVWVFEENENSINFYKKHGFMADGMTRIHDYGKPVNSIRMRRIV
jgi:ribosomal protein S18 acetylase RimI-like enzyme